MPSSTLTAAQRRELAALATLPDDKIDYSDIPPLTERFRKNAVPPGGKATRAI